MDVGSITTLNIKDMDISKSAYYGSIKTVAAGQRYKDQAALKKYVRVQAIPVKRDDIKKMVGRSVVIDKSINENLNDDSILSGDFQNKGKGFKIKSSKIINQSTYVNTNPPNVNDFISHRNINKKS